MVVCVLQVGGPPVPRLLGLIDTDQHIIADYVSDTEVRPRGVRRSEIYLG